MFQTGTSWTKKNVLFLMIVPTEPRAKLDYLLHSLSHPKSLKSDRLLEHILQGKLHDARIGSGLDLAEV